MRSLLLGIFFIIIIGVGGLVYRNVLEYRVQPTACPLDALVCPDGTSVSRTSLACSFPACPPPNVSLSDMHISFALPEGFTSGSSDAKGVMTYSLSSAASLAPSITIRRYAITASTTALATIQQTAVDEVSKVPVSATSYSSTVLGNYRFTVIVIQRLNGTVDTAYYLARTDDVLRFDAIDTGVTNWSDKDLKTTLLPAHRALEKLLTTLQGQ